MEEFEISLSGLSTGTHTIELQATDAAGLTTDPIVGNPHSNVEESFEVIDQPDGLSVTAVSAEIDFRSHVLQDQLASSGVWGNGKLHLKPTLDFDYQALFEKDYFLFGYDFGKAEVSVSPAIDSEYLWIGTDRGDIMYLDKNTNAYTLYPSIHDSRVTQVTEFMAGSNRMLFISYYQSGTTILYDTKGTMSDIGDDTYVAYNSKTNFNVIDGTTYPSETVELYNRGFSVFAIDNTQATTALFVNLNNGEEAEDLGSYYIARIDTKNTFDIEDDTITYWGQSDGIRGDVVEDGFNDIIGTYFDADRNTLVLNSYVNGTYICDLGATPNDKSDDNCYKTTSGSIDTAAAFSIVEDDSNIYWFGGDAGIWTLDTKDTVATDDDVFALMVSIANIGNEHIQKMYWHEGDDPIGSEIIFATREGHIRVFNYNSTYTDTIDDVSYDFSLPDALYRTGNGFGYYIESDDTIWIGSQAVGVSKVEITRSYEDENTVIIIPPLPYGMAAANYFRLESIIGSVSTGSAYSLDDLTSYDISNDGGTTWEPIVYGETVFFPTAGDQLRFRITMTKGSTPILEYIKLVFHSYATTEEAEVYDPDMMISLNTGSGDNNNNSSSGNSGGSSSSGGSCGESAPGSAPYIWKVESMGGDKIKIYFNDSWQPVTDYHLVYGVQSGKYIHGGISVARYGDKSVIVSKLNPNLKYFFKLIPYNRCASGPWSNEVSIKSGSRYSILTNNVKNTVNQVTQKLTTSKSDIETSPVITPSVTPEYRMPAIQEPPKKETIFDKILKFFGLR